MESHHTQILFNRKAIESLQAFPHDESEMIEIIELNCVYLF